MLYTVYVYIVNPWEIIFWLNNLQWIKRLLRNWHKKWENVFFAPSCGMMVEAQLFELHYKCQRPDKMCH